MKGIQFWHEGEQWFVSDQVGPVTTLCLCVTDNRLYQFKTQELYDILREQLTDESGC